MTIASTSLDDVETKLQAFRIATLVLHSADIYEARAIIKEKPEYIHLEHPKNKRTLLIQLLSSDSQQAIEALIEAGADVNHVSKNGYTPLHIAATHADDGMVRFLLERGANVNAVNLNGSTPLANAIMVANGKECMIALLKAGADVTRGNLGDSFDVLVDRHIPDQKFAEVHALIKERKLELALGSQAEAAAGNIRKNRF
jgi:ankyrin repeat protein